MASAPAASSWRHPISQQRSLIDDEAIAYHEGIPGHHMQLSVAQQLTELPKFRQHGHNSGYIEGWALYAEQLGKEVGFYQDPVSDYGRLSSELFRAVRLVVDTGIHSKGWSRDQVVEFFRKYRRGRRADDPGGDGSLHRLAGAGAVVQARPAEVPRAARARAARSWARSSTSAASTTRC